MKALMNMDYGSGNRDRRSPRRCDFPGCGQNTREGKAFCSDHVEHQPYAKWVIEQIEAREKEVERVKKRGGKISAKSEVTRDLLGFIVERGCCTLERLRRERMHDADEATVERYIKSLAKKGLVKISKTTRGRLLIEAVAGTSEAGVQKM